jgi:hypothetical protein
VRHLKYLPHSFELTDGCLLGITTDNDSSNELMTGNVQLKLGASGIKWPALINHIRCMPHIMQLGIAAFMDSPGVTGCTKSW